MPVCALLLKGLYWRSKRYYIEHLIFSVHLHTWGFLVLMVSWGYFGLSGMMTTWLPRWLALTLLGWMAWYLLTAFRVVYRQGWVATILKAMLLGGLYFFALLLLMLVIMVGTIAWLTAQ